MSERGDAIRKQYVVLTGNHELRIEERINELAKQGWHVQTFNAIYGQEYAVLMERDAERQSKDKDALVDAIQVLESVHNAAQCIREDEPIETIMETRQSILKQVFDFLCRHPKEEKP